MRTEAVQGAAKGERKKRRRRRRRTRTLLRSVYEMRGCR
jgi:hypothetical protein